MVHERACLDDPAAQIRMTRVDARVDQSNPDPGSLRMLMSRRDAERRKIRLQII